MAKYEVIIRYVVEKTIILESADEADAVDEAMIEFGEMGYIDDGEYTTTVKEVNNGFESV
jgi:hypothetical protein